MAQSRNRAYHRRPHFEPSPPPGGLIGMSEAKKPEKKAASTTPPENDSASTQPRAGDELLESSPAAAVELTEKEQEKVSGGLRGSYLESKHTTSLTTALTQDGTLD